MAINLRCDCGRQLKLRDNLAGKKIRCPDCAEVLTVSDGDEDIERSSGDDEFEDYDADSSPRSSREHLSASGRKQSRHAPAKKSPSTGLIIGLVIGGVTLLGLIGAGVALIVGAKGNNVAQNPPQFQQPMMPGPAPRVGEDPNLSYSIPSINNPAINDVFPPGNDQPTPPSVAPLATAPGGDVWVVLTNFRQIQQPGRGPFGVSYSVDYRVVSGQPDASKKYVLTVRNPSAGGTVEHVFEADVALQNSGTATLTPGPAFGLGQSSIRASMAYRKAGRDREKVSGEITIGGAETSATPPPSIQQLAGPTAQGKMVAIANAKLERGLAAFPTLTVDYVLQHNPDGLFYFLVAKTPSGDGIEFDISSELRRARPGERATLGGRIAGAPVNGPFIVHIEKRNSPVRGPFAIETPEVVSNSISTQ